MTRLFPPQEARCKEGWSLSSVPFWYDKDYTVYPSRKGTQADCGLKLLAHLSQSEDHSASAKLEELYSDDFYQSDCIWKIGCLAVSSLKQDFPTHVQVVCFQFDHAKSLSHVSAIRPEVGLLFFFFEKRKHDSFFYLGLASVM